MTIVHDMFLLIPELAAGVKQTRKLLKRRVFLGQASTSETRIDPSPLRNDVAVDLAHALYPAQRHGHVELARENVDRGGDPRLAPRAQTIDIGAPDHARARPRGEGAHQVLAGA